MNYPALYYTADTCSARVQRVYYFFLGTQLIVSVLIAILGVLSCFGVNCNSMNIVLLLVLLGAAVANSLGKFLNKWYLYRALAESIKTLSWRFVMGARPFNVPDDDASVLFLSRMREITKEYRDTIAQLDWSKEDSYITSDMERIRSMNPSEKRKFYFDHRVIEQKNWYANKAQINKKRFYIMLGIAIVCAIIALMLASCNFLEIEQNSSLICVFVMAFVSVLSWSDSKRYEQLYGIYGWTTKDLALLLEEFEANCRDIAACVADAENAFSREHSSWLSRKDN